MRAWTWADIWDRSIAPFLFLLLVGWGVVAVACHHEPSGEPDATACPVGVDAGELPDAALSVDAGGACELPLREALCLCAADPDGDPDGNGECGAVLGAYMGCDTCIKNVSCDNFTRLVAACAPSCPGHLDGGL